MHIGFPNYFQISFDVYPFDYLIFNIVYNLTVHLKLLESIHTYFSQVDKNVNSNVST